MTSRSTATPDRPGHHTVRAGWQGDFWALAARMTGMSTEAGARPQLCAATDPDAKDGELYGPQFVSNGPPVRLPVLRPGIQRDVARLWQVSERETGIGLDVAAAVREAG
ncbi:MAG TPA: hypothetical protein VGR21_13710 [Cryptosporangiaceae bacterium]|nr:hypothetical protein [Cryptosporangiaceae bacterium]